MDFSLKPGSWLGKANAVGHNRQRSCPVDALGWPSQSFLLANMAMAPRRCFHYSITSLLVDEGAIAHLLTLFEGHTNMPRQSEAEPR
jgi:hypothetical protein